MVFRVNPNDASNADYAFDRVAFSPQRTPMATACPTDWTSTATTTASPTTWKRRASNAYIAPSGQGAAMVDVDHDGLDDALRRRTSAITTAAASKGLTPVDTGRADAIARLPRSGQRQRRHARHRRARRRRSRPPSPAPPTPTATACSTSSRAARSSTASTVNDNNLIGTNFNLADSDGDTLPTARTRCRSRPTSTGATAVARR